jgi:protein-tyrosine-phosphatase
VKCCDKKQAREIQSMTIADEVKLDKQRPPDNQVVANNRAARSGQPAPHILVVCTANICRSPVAEAVLRDRLRQAGLSDWIVSSAGTWAERARSAAAFSTQILAEQGLDLTGHRSRVVTAEIMEAVDLLLCMESGHAEALRAEFPALAGKVYLLSQMIGRRFSISDPYGGSLEDYRRMVQDVTAVIEQGLPRIIELGQGNAVEED